MLYNYISETYKGKKDFLKCDTIFVWLKFTLKICFSSLVCFYLKRKPNEIKALIGREFSNVFVVLLDGRKLFLSNFVFLFVFSHTHSNLSYFVFVFLRLLLSMTSKKKDENKIHTSIYKKNLCILYLQSHSRRLSY